MSTSDPSKTVTEIRELTVGDLTAIQDIAYTALAKSATTTVQDTATRMRATHTVAVAAIARAFAELQTAPLDQIDRQKFAIQEATKLMSDSALQFKQAAFDALDVIERIGKNREGT